MANSDSIVEKVRMYLHVVIRVCMWIAAGTLSLLVLLLVANVFSRFVFRKPLTGTIELVDLLTLVTVFLVLAYTETRNGHVSIDMVVKRFPGKAQLVLAAIMSFLTVVYYFAMSWQGGEQMWSNLFPFRTTTILGIPFAPFMLVIVFGSLLLGLEILLNMLLPPSKQFDKGEVKEP